LGSYTDAQRAKMPESAFCGPDRSFPVLDAADARKALQALGRADAADRASIRACVLNRAERHGWQVTADMAAFPAAFTGDPMGEGADAVLRTGPIFEIGAYPDKDFTLTEAEADAAIAAFTPQAADYEHTPGPLDGHLGDLLTVWRDGTTLYGTAMVPRWADTALAAAGHKLSLAWDRATKQIVGWAWVTDPRVSHAQLAAAFAAQHKEMPRMSWKDTILEALRGVPDSFEPPALADTPAPAAPVIQSTELTTLTAPADFSAREAEIARREAAQATKEAEFARTQWRAEAERAVDGLITAGKILPAEDAPGADGQRPLVALFAQALADDAAGAATFTAAGSSRYAALSAAYSARAVVAPVGEQLPVVTLSTGPETVPVDLEARKRELLAQSDGGRAALKLKQQKEA
jgi:hypothetical protein